MPIELHCNHCNHLVRAPDNAGGRMGKCPYCHQQVYIPTPPDQLELLDLAPEDENWQERKRRLDQESKAVTDALRKEKAGLDEQGSPRASGSAREPGPAPARGTDTPGAGTVPARKGAEGLVIAYLLAMRNSQLDKARAAVQQLAGKTEEAKRFAQQLSMDPMPPPELTDVPPGVLQGFLRNLISQL